MKVELSKNKKELVITLPVNKKPTLSGSGKTLSVASSAGNKKTDVMIDGQALIVGVNAYLYAEPKG